MWRWMRRTPLMFVTLAGATLALGQQRGTESKAEHGMEALTRFQGKVAVRTKTAVLRPLSVAIRNWQLHGTQRIEAFPERGSLVIQLHSGKVKTVINGKEAERKQGEFWFVPAGARMSVEVTSESALLQVFSLQK